MSDNRSAARRYGNAFNLPGEEWSKAADQGLAVAEEYAPEVVEALHEKIAALDLDPDRAATAFLNAVRLLSRLVGEGELDV